MLKFEDFHRQMLPLGCFTPADIASCYARFDKNNLTRWCANGYILKLRNGFYTFPEYIKLADFQYFVANRIYPGSYVSLHSALVYHGYLSSQLNVQISSVSPLKTSTFRNYFGKFSYQTLRENLLFGYEEFPAGGFAFRMAAPEKAIADLFYLYPRYYDTEQGIRSFAIEEQKLYEELDVQRLYECVQMFENQSLESRIGLLARMYGL